MRAVVVLSFYSEQRSVLEGLRERADVNGSL